MPAIASSTLEARGEIVESKQLTDRDIDTSILQVGTATRAIYRSTSGVDGASTEVSGVFVAPSGKAPDGGWPVIAYAHGTTGLTADCGPSRFHDLKGYASAVAAIVKSGFAVAMTDYQGLGTGSGSGHPYLEPRTVAFNVIDSVRAIRNLFPRISMRWMAVGGSQGGQAAWAANEYARDYGAGLDLVGSVALAPAVDVSGLAELAETEKLSPAQIVFMPLIIAGLHEAHPGLDQRQYLSGTALSGQLAMMSCTDNGGATKESLYSRLDADQVRPATAAADDELRAMLTEWALPHRKLSAPMLVINGGKDDLVLPEWVDGAVGRACLRGGTIKHVVIPDAGHTDLDPGDVSYRWMIDRFRGKEAPSDC